MTVEIYEVMPRAEIEDKLAAKADQSKWANKNWTVIGDSITEHNYRTNLNYHDYIAQKIGCIVTNLGVSGTGWRTPSSSGGTNAIYQRLNAVPSNSDLITVFAGTNDWGEVGIPMTLGSFGDTSAATSFYGAVDQVLSTLIANNPTKTIAVFTPLERADAWNNAIHGTKTPYAYNNPAFTNTGAWNTGTYANTPSEYIATSTVTANAVFKPNTSINGIEVDYIQGRGAGILKVELSQDNGTTWANPSTIDGLTRSDGATGNALNTIDQYTNAYAVYTSITYNFPSSGTWAIRLTPNNTTNPAASATTNVFICGAQAIAGSTVTLATIVNAIKQVANKYSIPVLDLYNNGSPLAPWNSTNNNTYFKDPGGDAADGLHPNDAGHKVLADKILTFLNTL